MNLIIAAMAAVGILLFFGGLVAARNRGTEFDPMDEEQYAPVSAGPTNPRDAFGGAMDAFNRALSSRPRTSKVADQLARADIKLRVSEYFLAVAGVMALAFMAVYFINHNFAIATIAGALSYFAPGFYVKHRQRKRSKALSSQLGDTILLLSNALKAGYSFAQAMATIAKSAPVPMSDEFTRAVREMNLGITVDDALEHMNQRMMSEDFDLLVTAVQIHRIVGGHLAEILDTIAFTIRERIRIHGEIRTLTAQARASGYIITGLPFALALILTFISPTYITPLFHEWLGYVLIGMGLVSIAIGYGIISKITNIQV